MNNLDRVFANITHLGIDTAPIIYFVETHPTYDTLLTNIFQRIADGALIGITSVISLLEVLVHPLRHKNVTLQQHYRTLLMSSDHFHTIGIQETEVTLAADLRARYPIHTPDALQIAVALSNGCEAFLTNDKRLKQVKELNIIVLDDLLS